ncbi:putative endolytic peptidoglycan transglycosylase RlpA [Halotydeus destructor]|nr:putative endolytic peptidoglycan transglycosylase RlpA [Halotydeus destructor]
MHSTINFIVFTLLLIALKSATAKPLKPVHVEHGICSYYGEEIPPGSAYTANGELFYHHHMTAAHKTLPFGSVIRVTNSKTKQSVIVRINDRGPHIHGRIVDLSHGASQQMSMYVDGVVKCKAEILALGDGPVPPEFKKHGGHLLPLGTPVHDDDQSPTGKHISTEIEKLSKKVPGKKKFNLFNMFT